MGLAISESWKITVTDYIGSLWMQISNAYLQFLRGPGTKMLFEFVKEMPKSETPLRIEVASLLGGLFYTWVILQLFPVSVEISEQIYQHE
jgi:hypothetical protein